MSADTKAQLTTPTTSRNGADTVSNEAVWLPLDRLRQLPLGPSERLALLRELSARPQPGRAALELWGELAELTLQCCQDAYEERRWKEALKHHDALLTVVVQLAEAVPERARAFWKRYGELLAFLTVAAHGVVTAVCSEDPEGLLMTERATLGWELAKRLRRAHSFPCEPPDWLAIHEEQLVQAAALAWCSLIDRGDEFQETIFVVHKTELRTIELLVRLHQLLDPAPEWVLSKARELVEERAKALMTARNPDMNELPVLLEALEQVPLEADERHDLQMKLCQTSIVAKPVVAEIEPITALTKKSQEVSHSISAETNVETICTRTLDQPYHAKNWSGNTSENSSGYTEEWGEDSAWAHPVFLDEGIEKKIDQLNLKPLLQEEFGTIDRALEEFELHLPQNSRVMQAAAAIQQALEPDWRRVTRIPDGALEQLAYLKDAWTRHLGHRIKPLEPIDWRSNLVIELNSTELSVIQSLLVDPSSLEEPLALIRREHHNLSFWVESSKQTSIRQTSIDALRSLHTDEGFYANSQEPMGSLICWGRDATQAILEAEIWTDDAGCFVNWLGVAQELTILGNKTIPTPAQPPMPYEVLRELGGLEVLYVGQQTAEVREAHQSGALFRGDPFGLRVLEPPASRWPSRPAGGYEQSYAMLLESVERLYEERPFAVLLADCGIYRLPLLRAMHQRYGVAALSSSLPITNWYAAGSRIR